MKVNKLGLELIKSFEGLSLKAYKDKLTKDGLPISIGYGSTKIDGKPIQLNLVINEAKATEMLNKDIIEFSKQLDKVIKTILTENQYNAILSFTYNLGIGTLSKSTLLKKVNKNPEDITIKDEFMKYTFAGGKESNGLIRRRLAEWTLYSKI